MTGMRSDLQVFAMDVKVKDIIEILKESSYSLGVLYSFRSKDVRYIHILTISLTLL